MLKTAKDLFRLAAKTFAGACLVTATTEKAAKIKSDRVASVWKVSGTAPIIYISTSFLKWQSKVELP